MIVAFACWFALMVMPVSSSLAPSLLATSSAASSHGDETWTPENVDEAWATKVLADPSYDDGWCQPCQDDWNDDREINCQVRELPFKATGGPLAIHGGENGGMTVIGWDRSTVRVIYRVKARARTKEEAKALAEQVKLLATKGSIRPEGPESRSGQWWSVEMKVWVPRSSDLSLETLNGSLGVVKVKGTMDIRSVNGPIALLDLSGAVQARAQNGPVHVELTGSKWIGAGLDAAAQNGPVHLEIPKNYSARLETGTINGPSDIDYPLTFQGRMRGHFTTTIGSGGPPVRVVTDNGPFHVSER